MKIGVQCNPSVIHGRHFATKKTTTTTIMFEYVNTIYQIFMHTKTYVNINTVTENRTICNYCY